MVPTPTDRMEFRKSTPDLKVQSAAKEHSSEVRGGGCDPGVGRPGAGPVSKLEVRSFIPCLFVSCARSFFLRVLDTTRFGDGRKRQRGESQRISVLMDMNDVDIQSLSIKLSLGITIGYLNPKTITTDRC